MFYDFVTGVFGQISSRTLLFLWQRNIFYRHKYCQIQGFVFPNPFGIETPPLAITHTASQSI